MTTVKDYKSGNIPAFCKIVEFRKVFPIGRSRLLELCKMPEAPIVRNGRTIVIKTIAMLEFIEKTKL
jgi:hypothetical protein